MTQLGSRATGPAHRRRALRPRPPRAWCLDNLSDRARWGWSPTVLSGSDSGCAPAPRVILPSETEIGISIHDLIEFLGRKNDRSPQWGPLESARASGRSATQAGPRVAKRVNRLRNRLILIFLAATLAPLAATIWITTSLLEESLDTSSTSQLDALSKSLQSAPLASFTSALRDDLKQQGAGRRDRAEQVCDPGSRVVAGRGQGILRRTGRRALRARRPGGQPPGLPGAPRRRDLGVLGEPGRCGHGPADARDPRRAARGGRGTTRAICGAASSARMYCWRRASGWCRWRCWSTWRIASAGRSRN